MTEKKEERLSDVDSAEQAYFVKVLFWMGPAVFIILVGIQSLLARHGVIPGWLLTILFVLDIPLTYWVAKLVHAGTGNLAEGFVATLTASGNLPPPPPAYVRQDVLLTQGKYAEAAEYFRDHIRVHPEDLEARLRLAAVLEKHLRGDAEAEQLYLEVRRSNPDQRREMAAANGLIDLYTRTGRKDRLKVELARFADRYAGSQHALEARRKLDELKADG
ncbi:MAG TPA: tetratricopeptide repeat protein [Gemmatimonadales bacterium]|nr:tetratricopeptide repeat protein [Gemmatimonadales bacterium]